MPFVRFDHPEWLVLLLLAVPVVWLGRRSLASLERGRQWTAIGMRLAVLTVITLMLAGLQGVKKHSDLSVIAVVDRSESMRRFAKPPTTLDTPEGMPANSIDEWVNAYLAASAQQRKIDDRFGLVTFDGRPTLRNLPAPGIELEGGTVEQPLEGTDIAAGIRLGMAAQPGDANKRIVLVTDGNDSTGSAGAVITAAREAAAAGIPIDVLPIDYQVQREVMVEAVHAPVDVRQGQTVSLRVVLRSTQPAGGLLHVLHDGKPLDLTPDAPGESVRIDAADWNGQDVLVRRVEAPLESTGVNRFSALFEPDKGADAMSSNNKAESFTLVQGKGQILILDGIGGDSGMILPDALAARGIEAVVMPRDAIPLTLADLQRYDAVVLHNVPAESVPAPQQKMLADYVAALGGGLIMIGGPGSFGAGGWTHTPVDRVLPVNCEIPSQTVLPSGALVMVIDRSGSMGDRPRGSKLNKQELANMSAALAARTLFRRDYVGVISFSFHGEWTYPLAPYTEPKTVHDLIISITQGGGTNIFDPLVQAYDALVKLANPDVTIRHIILLTDGEGKGGDYDTYLKNLRRKGITLSTIGVGDGINRKLLERLGKEGGGNFYPIKDPSNLPQIFVKEARQIRKSLIREVAFEPKFNPKSRSPILSGIRKAPTLQGLVRTATKKDPRIYMPLLGPEGEPLFAHWQVQLGRTAAFTSDATNRWAVDWLPWGGYADFWARTMRAIARPAASRDFDMVATVERNRLKIRLDAGAAAAGMKVSGSVVLPNNKTIEVELDPVGPGQFTAELPAELTGSYVVSLFAKRGSERQYVYGGVNRSPGEELRRFSSNRPLLEQIASITNGRVLDPATVDPEALFARTPTLLPTRSIRSLWRELMIVLLVLYMLDVAIRRVAWDVTAAVARLRQWRSAPPKRGAESQQTLSALKDRAKERTEEEAPAPPPVPPGAARHFEATETDLTEADLAKPVSSAKQTTTTEEQPPPKRQAATSTTNRLLDAKRRARKRLDDKDPP